VGVGGARSSFSPSSLRVDAAALLVRNLAVVALTRRGAAVGHGRAREFVLRGLVDAGFERCDSFVSAMTALGVVECENFKQKDTCEIYQRESGFCRSSRRQS